MSGSQASLIGAIRPPKTIVNAYSAGGTSTATAAGKYASGIKTIASGALTAGAYSKILDIAGSGVISFLSAYAADATARTVGLKLVIDGATPFDATSNSVSAAESGVVAVGATFPSAPLAVALQPMPFNTSMQVWVKSSLSETNKVSADCLYYLT